MSPVEDDSTPAELILQTPADLYFAAGVESDQELADWISESTELDAVIDHNPSDPTVIVVAFMGRGTTIEFPISVEDFWAAVDELHEELEEEMEADLEAEE